MRQQYLLMEAVTYFKSNKGFHRIFELMKHKYKSLGTLGGTIELRNLSLEEQDILTGFLRKDYMHRKSVIIKVQDFQKSLGSTKYQGLLMEDILCGYFGDELMSNTLERNIHLQARSDFFTKIINKYENTMADEWLKQLLESKDNAYRILVQGYENDKDRLLQDIEAACEGLNNLPVLSDRKLRLPVFASDITKNPHVFDENTSSGQIFLHALAHRFEVDRPRNAEDKAELYYAAGILIDEVSNYVFCNGLTAYANGVLHPGWEGFNRCKEPLQVSLANLSTLDKVTSPWGKVYVFENAGVFAAILDKIAEHHPPLICSYGQVKIASLFLMDLLAKEDTDIYYSGDFDPEGLSIADRLKVRYGDRLKLWRYDSQNYENAMSGETINDVRMKKLESLQNPELIDLAKFIKQSAHSGYQELLLHNLINDIMYGKDGI